MEYRSPEGFTDEEIENVVQRESPHNMSVSFLMKAVEVLKERIYQQAIELAELRQTGSTLPDRDRDCYQFLLHVKGPDGALDTHLLAEPSAKQKAKELLNQIRNCVARNW